MRKKIYWPLEFPRAFQEEESGLNVSFKPRVTYLSICQSRGYIHHRYPSLSTDHWEDTHIQGLKDVARIRNIDWGGKDNDDSHITTRIIAGDVPSLCYMVVRTGVWTETRTRPRRQCLNSVLEKMSVCRHNSARRKSALTCSMPVVIWGEERKREEV